MSEIKHLKQSIFPKIVQEFTAENFNLKVLCALLLGIVMVALVLVLYLVKHGPLVIAIEGNGQISQIETKVTDLQIQSAVKEYLSYRYSWDQSSIGDRLKKAEFFVLPNLVPSFQKSMMEVQKFVHEKKVSQRVYTKSMELNLKERKVVIHADRITEFDSLKAATEMHLTLQFKIDDRSIINPWGVYIVKESEGSAQ